MTTFHLDSIPTRQTEEVKTGDLVWQQRHPGGACVVIEIILTPQRFPELQHDYCWDDDDFPILRLLHPTEGIIEDPSYYYTPIQVAIDQGWFDLEEKKDDS